MIKLTSTSDLRLAEYTKRIKSVGYILIDRQKMFLTLGYEKVRLETNRSLARRVMAADSGSSYADMERKSVIHFLVNVKGVPEARLKSRDTAGLSLNASTVLEPLKKQGMAVEFLNYYIEYNSLKSKCSRAEGLLTSLREHGDVSDSGKVLHRLHYNVEAQENLRFNYNNQDIISIPVDYSDTFTAEDDYILAWGDFAQSDFRIAYNLFIRDERNSELMDKTKDKYEGIARVLAEYENVPFDEDKFHEERELYKVNVLETMYGQRKGKTARDDQFIKRFYRYLKTCPRYMEYISRIGDRINLGLPIPVTAYFGFTQQVFVDANKPERSLTKALNTPIQTATSQIVILLVNAILDKFYSLGYTEDDISVYVVRHDEPIFKMRRKVLKDAWVFHQFNQIIVDNWTPLELEFDFGKYYGISDSELVDEAEKSHALHIDKIETYYPDTVPVEYSPVPRTFSVCVGSCNVADKTILAIYSPEMNAVKYYSLPLTQDIGELAKVALNKIMSNWEHLESHGYTGAVIFNSWSNQDTFHEDIYFRMTKKPHSHVDTAHLFANWMCARVALKYGKVYEQEGNMELSEAYKAFEPNKYSLDVNSKLLESAGDLDVLQG